MNHIYCLKNPLQKDVSFKFDDNKKDKFFNPTKYVQIRIRFPNN